MSMNLDKEKPFGTICGPSPFPGAMYEQDGMFFSASGELVSGLEQGVVVEEQANGPVDELSANAETGGTGESATGTVEDPGLEQGATSGGEDAPIPTEQILALAKEGLSPGDIGKQVGLHHMTIKKVLSDAGL